MAFTKKIFERNLQDNFEKREHVFSIPKEHLKSKFDIIIRESTKDLSSGGKFTYPLINKTPHVLYLYFPFDGQTYMELQTTLGLEKDDLVEFKIKDSWNSTHKNFEDLTQKLIDEGFELDDETEETGCNFPVQTIIKYYGWYGTIALGTPESIDKLAMIFKIKIKITNNTLSTDYDTATYKFTQYKKIPEEVIMIEEGEEDSENEKEQEDVESEEDSENETNIDEKEEGDVEVEKVKNGDKNIENININIDMHKKNDKNKLRRRKGKKFKDAKSINKNNRKLRRNIKKHKKSHRNSYSNIVSGIIGFTFGSMGTLGLLLGFASRLPEQN